MIEQEHADFCSKIMKCSKCDLGCESNVSGFNQHVPGNGNLNAKIMFISETPGLQETKACAPFVPQSLVGIAYEKIMAATGLKKENIFFTNAILCRPPDNRAPEEWEIHKCRNHLFKQFELVRPKLIVTFGRIAAQAFLNEFKITRDHGKLKKSDAHNVYIFPLYHPAYIDIHADEEKKKQFKNDILTLKAIVSGGGLIE